MALTAEDLDGFLPLLATTDNKSKLTIANNLINYLGEPDNSIECSDIGQFIDSLIPWMQSSNNKVSQSGIDAMTYLVDRMRHDFRPYIATVFPPIIDRLGDSKEVVREKAQLLLLRLTEREVVTPQALLERLTPAFAHKNGKIREEALHCLQTTLTEHGAASLSVSRVVPHVVKLLSDPMASVRDTAFSTLVEVYRHVGERLRNDLNKKHPVPPSKLPALMARFDELRLAGDLLPSALAADGPRSAGGGDDEVDCRRESASMLGSGTASSLGLGLGVGLGASAPKRASSVPRRSAPTSAGSTSGSSTASGKAAAASSSSSSSGGGGGGQAGAMDEEAFVRAFEDVPSVSVFSARELGEQLAAARDVVGDPAKDWNKRVDAMKKLRALMLSAAAGGHEDVVLAQLRLLEPSLQTGARDLRSQVVRETCITVAFLSEQLGHKADRFAEALLPHLIQLIPNSAKVMASAGTVSVRFILRHTHAPRLVPIIARELASKSRDIRRACCEFLELVLNTWATASLERNAALLQDALKKGIADADPEARLSARKAYWAFRSHFPEQAEHLLNSLDASYRRALNGELTLSNSSSSNSLHHHAGTASRYSSAGTVSRLRMPGSAQDGTSATPVRRGAGAASGVGLRSSSAIDLQAAQRAKARAQYAALARHKVGSGASLPRPRKSSDAGISSMTSSTVTSPERVGRTRSRMSGVSQSQPSSRSGSPSSRLSYATYAARMDAAQHNDGHATSRPRRLIGIPRSTGTSREASRETSPNRFGTSGFGSKLRGRPLTSMGSAERPPSSRPVMAQKILQQSIEAESALADALNFETMDSGDYTRGIPKRKRLFDDHSDDSETSSVCSERSFDSFRRPSDDIADIISNCASTHWADRKEGLVGLQNFLQSGQLLGGSELQKVTEIFTKMFMDVHTKVFSLFLDTLYELVQAHRADLNDWLYVLLTRLLNKLGTDLLGSINGKVLRLLNLIRESFPPELVMATVLRFLVDATQTPNGKVRTSTLTFLAQLCVSCGEPGALQAKDPAPAALARIILLTTDAKSSEVRRAAHTAFLALFNLSTAQVTMLLADLPTEYQEAAAPLLQNHLRRSSGSGGSPPSPTASPSAALSSPGTPQTPRQPHTPLQPTPHDVDDLNPEEVYRSLRRTTAEIQSYSFGDLTLSGGTGGGTAVAVGLGGKLPDRDRDTTSQDSGISQMSAGGGDKVDALEEHFEALSLTRTNSGRSSSLSSPTHRLNSLHDYNGLDSVTDTSLGHAENGYVSREAQEDNEAIRKALDTVRLPESPDGDVPLAPESDRKHAFYALQRLAKEGSISAINENFKVLLRVLLEYLSRPDIQGRDWALGVLAELLNRRALASSFQKYVELLVLKVLELHRDSSKDVARMAEVCGDAVGTVLPPDIVIRVLNPLITTGDFPVNVGAIKMLMKVVQSRPKEALEPHLENVMPALLKAYNNDESAVRKSAVFCMVALHNALGEAALQPHIATLSGSKLKLLHLYIRRAQSGGSSAPTSPKNNPT